MGNDSFPASKSLSSFEIDLNLFEKQESIPHGVFGQVQRVVDRKTKKPFHLKETLLPEDEEMACRSIEKVESFMKLSHSNLLKPIGTPSHNAFSLSFF